MSNLCPVLRGLNDCFGLGVLRDGKPSSTHLLVVGTEVVFKSA